MKKLYEETAVQDIAAAIREKNGTATKYKVAEMGDAVRGITGAEEVAWHQCPEAVRNYLSSVTYDPGDYSTSQIASYAPATAVVSNYKPIGQTVGGVTYYNEVPNVLTPFASGGKAGTLKPLDALRWIRTRDSSAEAWNVRDLGGWACDGGTVKYGLLIRGGRISAADRAVLVGQFGVLHEIDLRGKEGRDPSDGEVATESPLGSDVRFTIADKAASYALTPVATWQLYLRCVIDAVTHREPVYFHCTAGADRTGTLACVLEGLLGMSQSDIDKDYELTTFYSGSGTDALARRRNEPEWKGLINAINAVSGDTFRDKCVHFAVGTCGMSMADINAYRAAMTSGTPETLRWYQTITKNLTGCTITNPASQVDYGEAYTTTIAADSGKTLTSVVVKMGGRGYHGHCLLGRQRCNQHRQGNGSGHDHCGGLCTVCDLQHHAQSHQLCVVEHGRYHRRGCGLHHDALPDGDFQEARFDHCHDGRNGHFRVGGVRQHGDDCQRNGQHRDYLRGGRHKHH